MWYVILHLKEVFNRLEEPASYRIACPAVGSAPHLFLTSTGSSTKVNLTLKTLMIQLWAWLPYCCSVLSQQYLIAGVGFLQLSSNWVSFLNKMMHFWRSEEREIIRFKINFYHLSVMIFSFPLLIAKVKYFPLTPELSSLFLFYSLVIINRK